MKFIRILTLFLLLFYTSSFAFDPLFSGSDSDDNIKCPSFDSSKELSILEAINLAICHDPTAKIAIATAMDKSAQLGIARSSYLPTIEATGSVGTSKQNDNSSVFDRGISASLVYNLYDFGARESRNGYAREVFESANASKDATIQTLFLNTIQYFYQALSAKQTLESATESEKYAQASYDAALKRYEVGVATPSDKLQAKTALSNAKLTKIKAAGALKNANALLASTVGIQPNSKIILADSTISTLSESVNTSLDGLIKMAKERRGEVISSAHDVKAAEESLYLAKSEYLPSITLRANAGYDNGSGISQGRSNSASINLTIPIFSGFSTLYSVKSAREKLKIAVSQKDKEEQAVALEVVTAYQNLLTTTQSLVASNDLLSSADESYKMAFGRYKSGVGSILELLNAQSTLSEAKNTKTTAFHDWQIAKVTLAKSIGELTMSNIKQ